MRAVTVLPLKSGTVDLTDLPEPPESDGPVVVKTRAVGVCGTDLEIIAGEYGWAPPGEERLAIGHESLGEVMSDDQGDGFAAGDLVVAIVRRPDPVPCANCAVGEWDMCRNGQYTEWGIKEHHGYARERYRITPDFVVKVDPSLGNLGVLLEPTTVVAKAWDHIERIGSRANWEPATVLATGAGPIGLLAALLGIQRGLEVHVLDRVESGPKPDLVRALAATYHTGAVSRVGFEPDVIIECTGVGAIVADSIQSVGSGGVVCLTGVGSGGSIAAPATGEVAAQVVLQNKVIVGSVNANKRHWYKAGAALSRADRSWLARLVTRRESPESFARALERKPEDIKVVIQFSGV